MTSFVYGRHYTSFYQVESLEISVSLVVKQLRTTFLHWIQQFLSLFPFLSPINAIHMLSFHFLNVNFNIIFHVQMSQVTCSFQNIRLKFSVNFLCPVRFIHFDLFIVSYPGRPESRFRDAGQYLTVTASPFNVLLETFGSAVVKLAVLLSLSAAVAQ